MYTCDIYIYIYIYIYICIYIPKYVYSNVYQYRAMLWIPDVGCEVAGELTECDVTAL